ncbi:MAG: winged helix-turn-helix domain-containing protein [Bryobacteraceae bacterium]|jgi:TolB-like protein/DNA-binding winged helix-turn-helix (wHTH) protein/Tfp pilus assembly protein PilF
MSLQAKAVFEFGLFRLNPAERLLLRQQVQVRLPPKAFDALVVLVENPGHLLEKEELLRRVWPGTFVEESNLAQHISILRKALQDGENGFRYIETVPKRGYRFVAEVRQLGGIPADTGTPPERMPRERRHSFRSLTFAIAVLGVLMAALILTPPVWKRLRSFGTQPIQSLAVLPLRNLSGDPEQDYFAEGMTEALITDLARIPGLKVISRTSIVQYKDSHKRLPQIARELGVDGVVEGSVLRSGNRVRITAQLVRGATDQHIWARSYERDLRDLVTLEDGVSRSIAEQVRRQIAPRAPQPPASSAAVSPQAREDYLKGRYFWNRRSEAGYLKAIDYFQAAVSEDPQYAQAYAGLADAYALLGSLPDSKTPRDKVMPKAKETALTALNLDDSLADAHTSLAFVEMHYEWRFPEAEQEFKRAIDLDANYSTAHQWYAFDLAAMGRLGEAVAELERARQTDPFSAIINTDAAEMLYYDRKYDEALRQARATLEIDPNFAHAHRVMERVYNQRHMFSEAIAEGRRALELSGDNPWMLLELAHTYQLAGKQTEMQDCLRRVANISPGGRLPEEATMAGIYAMQGDADRAWKVMENLYRRRDGGLILLNVDPCFEVLKSDPRFQEFSQRVGLPH